MAIYREEQIKRQCSCSSKEIIRWLISACTWPFSIPSKFELAASVIMKMAFPAPVSPYYLSESLNSLRVKSCSL
jgi:hypothetical protein